MKFTDRFKTRPASYSFFNSWEWNKDEWYDNYILGKRKEANDAMLFGSLIGDAIGTLDNPIPGLDPAGVKEYEFKASLGDVHLVGYADHYCPIHKILNENKTSDNTTRWTQKTVDDHTQIDMYLLMLWLSKKVKPQEVTVFLNFIPVRIVGVGYKLLEPPIFTTFKTKRTMRQILEYGAYIQKTVALMEAYVESRA